MLHVVVSYAPDAVQGVPALVCENCGEASIDAATAKKANEQAEREMARGVALEFCNFAA